MNFKSKTNLNYFLLLVIVLGFTLRLSWILQKHDLFQLEFGDERAYYISTAVNSYLGKGFYPESNDRTNEIYVPPPLQSLFILSVFKVAGKIVNPFYLILIQVLLSTFSLYIVYRIARFFCSEKLAILASLLAAIYPDFIFYTGFLLTENNYLFGLTLFLWLLLLWLKNGSIKFAFLCSITLGLLHLQRGIGLLLGFLLAFYILFFWKGKKKVIHAAIFISIPFLILLPWFARNMSMYQDPIWVNSNGGILFHYANRINLDPLKTPFWFQMWHFEKPGPLIKDVEKRFRKPDGTLKTTYYRYSSAYFDVAKSYILHHPIHFFKNTILKTYNEFALPPILPLEVTIPIKHPKIIYLLIHFLILIFGVLGVVCLLLSKKNPKGTLLFFLCFFYYTFFGSLFTLTADGRMNLYLKLFLIICITAGLDALKKSAFTFKKIRFSNLDK